ncbi:lipopolysaccharide biosynthesis protein [Parabacteroides distasonis]|uniref:lipopolysaccharide biosynthesis protein n=1 Tax=Parabacteroides distasonis TaxID=823 RepID=UPI0028056907|nr:oligosaccharide flippase family protein [Parabacteroides distasonis]WMI42497.1 oligosaccharide flippase family protein [Parabacteroides distasonis]
MQSKILKKCDNRTIQVLLLMLANLISHSTGLITSIVFSHLMPQNEYGTYRQVIYVYSILLIVFSLGLPKAYSYFLARVPIEEGLNIIKRLNSLFLGISAIVSCILLFGAYQIADLLKNPSLTYNLMYFSITPMLLMPVMGVESILTVYGMSRIVIIYVAISRTFMIVCTILPVILINATASSAIIGFVISAIITCLTGLILITIPFRGIKPRKSQIPMNEIFRFIKPISTASLYGFIISSASQFFISRYFGVKDFAAFSNGYRELPFAGMLISATATILLPEFSKMSNHGINKHEFIKLWKSVTYKSSAIIYPLSIFCFIFAEEIINLLYGEKYLQSITLFRIATIINLIRIVPYSPIMLALGKGKAFSDTHLITAILLVSLNLLCVNFFPSTIGIAIVTTFSTLFCLIILILIIARSLETTIVKFMPWVKMLKMLFAAILSCITTRMAISSISTTHIYTLLALEFGIYLPLYIFISNLLGVNYQKVLKPIISRNKKKEQF